MIENKNNKTLHEIHDECYEYSDNVSLKIQYDDSILDNIDYDDVIKYMDEEVSAVNSVTKEQINELIAFAIEGRTINYDITLNFYLLAYVYKDNITHYMPSKWNDIQFYGENKLKENRELILEMKGIDTKIVDEPLNVQIDKLSEDDSFWD